MKRTTVLVTRCVCALPGHIKSLCETGCVYREPGFKHLACPVSRKTDTCVAPCPPIDCKCKNERMQGLKKHKYYNEVFLL